MTKEQILNSIALKKRFAKDMNLPISIFDNPYFEYQLDLINKYEPCLNKWKRFCDELEQFSNEEEYFNFYNEIKEEVITFIQNTTQYARFNDTKTYNFEPTKKYASRDVYKEDNLGKCLISVDMKEANFTAMRIFEPWIFNGCQTWSEFISKFTNKLHIIGSKYIRQVIFGACNPGRQVKAETYLMSHFAEQLEDEGLTILSVTADEIIIECKYSDDFDLVVSWCQKHNALKDLKVQQFSLEKLHGKTGWVKHISRDTSTNPVVASEKKLKCVSSIDFCQVLKYMLKLPIEDNDLIFHYDGRPCKFLQPLDNPFETKI